MENLTAAPADLMKDDLRQPEQSRFYGLLESILKKRFRFRPERDIYSISILTYLTHRSRRKTIIEFVRQFLTVARSNKNPKHSFATALRQV
jgi:hypothetical protein